MSLKVGVLRTNNQDCKIDPLCPRRYPVVEATRLACEFLKFNCTFEWYKDTNYGDALENGTVTGAIGSVYRREYDTFPPSFTPTFSRHKAVSFSDTYDVVDYVFVTRAPDRNESTALSWDIYNAFQLRVWITLAFVYLFVTVFLTLIVSKFCFIVSNRLFLCFEFATSLVTYDFGTSMLKPRFVRVVLIGWICSGMVISSAYTGILFSKSLSVQRYFPYTDVDSFISCLEKEECRLITATKLSSIFYQLFTAPNSTLNKRFFNSLERNPAAIATQDKIYEMILAEKNQYFVAATSGDSAYHLINSNRNCSYYIINSGYSEVWSFPIAKNSTHLRKWTKAATIMREYGLSKALKRKYVGPDLCFTKISETVSVKGKNVINFISITLIVFVSGIFLATVAFVVEITHKRGH
jgi:hypothetical protein